MVLLGPIFFFRRRCQCSGMGHSISSHCCRLPHFGPLGFWQMLLMHWDGPFALAAAAAHGFPLAQYFSNICYRCPGVGPLRLQLLLPLGSLWPIMFPADAANGFAWANLFFRRYFRCPRMGPLQ